MKDHLEKQPDQTHKLDSGQGAGQSSQFDPIRYPLGADGRRNTCIPQSGLFKDYLSYTHVGSDVPPQHSEETLSTSFRHDAPSQKSPMSALGPLELGGIDDALLRQAANHYELGKRSEKTDKDYAQGHYKQAEQRLKCVLDNCTEKPKPNSRKIELVAHGLAQVYKMQGRHGDTEEVYSTLIENYAQEHQPDDLKIGAAMKGLAKVYEIQGKYKEAKELAMSALLVSKESFGNSDPRTGWAMKSLATIYEKMEKPAKAKTLLHDVVLPIFEEKLGENDLKTEHIRQKLKDLPVKPEQDLGKIPGSQRLIGERWVNILLKHIKYYKRFPDISDPKLFSDKVLHRKLFDRRPIRTQFADKVAVRQYVKDRIGEEYLPKLYHVTTDPRTIPFKDLPEKFVIKSTNGSQNQQVRVVTDKSTMNESEIREECNKWLNDDLYKKTGSWLRKNVKTQVVIEEYINDGKGEAPYDYKFFTYNGVPHYIQVEAGRFQDYSSTFHDMDWNRLPMTHGTGKNCSTPIDKPPHLKQMIELAQKLGKSQDFARIDFYDTPEKVFFGEITNTPAGGQANFAPSGYDRIFGEHWTEVHNKSRVQSLPPSHEVCRILRQITRGMYKAVSEGQSNRQYSQVLDITQPVDKKRKAE
jgi:tetratricopeptide (TPR) repeat protein